MRRRALKGTTEWAEYSIILPLHPEARAAVLGVLVAGTGKTSADDLEILVDGKAFLGSSPAKEPETVLSRDHEFDGGSKIAIRGLTSGQIESLAVLGKCGDFSSIITRELREAKSTTITSCSA